MAIKTWKIDPLHSTIGFTIRHMVVSKVRGRFTRWSAELELDEDDLTRSRVSVSIEAASVDTGVEDRDDDLRSTSFFDAAGHPELRFISKRIERLSDRLLELTGDLTIRGTTHEVTLEVETEGSVRDPWGARRAGFAAHAHIDRKAFGLSYNQILEGGGLLVGDRVDIDVQIEAVLDERAQQAA